PIAWVLAAFFLSDVVTPAAEVKVSEANLLLLGHAGGGRLSSGYWFKEEGPEGGTRIINIERLQPNGGVAGINLYEFNKSQELTALSQAEQGYFGNDNLVMTGVVETQIDANAVSALADAQEPKSPITEVNNIAERSIGTTLTPERLIARIL